MINKRLSNYLSLYLLWLCVAMPWINAIRLGVMIQRCEWLLPRYSCAYVSVIPNDFWFRQANHYATLTTLMALASILIFPLFVGWGLRRIGGFDWRVAVALYVTGWTAYFLATFCFSHWIIDL